MQEMLILRADLSRLLLGSLYSKIGLRGKEPSQLDLK
jgi:hypothetical protein